MFWFKTCFVKKIPLLALTNHWNIKIAVYLESPRKTNVNLVSDFFRKWNFSKNGFWWKDDFGGPLFFSHRKSNSCGVTIGYCGTEAFTVVNTAYDKNGQILILDAELNGKNLLPINFYNSNTESEQLSTFSTLQKLLEKFDDYNKTNIVFGGDFNLIFDCKFDKSGGKPILKKKISSKTNGNKRNSPFVWYLENKKS